jgi:CPA1 family monovalent cation:H+ antiporter
MPLAETASELSISGSIIIILLLLFVASLTSPLMKKIRFPHSVFLVIVGLAIGIASKWLYIHTEAGWIQEIMLGINGFQLSSDAILFIFLPTLIFESSYNINSRELIKDLPYILILAVPALLISIFTVGFSLHYFVGLDLQVSLLFGALISATDPVAVIAIFKELGAPKRLTLLVEGESLFNDATSVVIFTIFLGLFTSAESFPVGSSLLTGAGRFIAVFTGGILVGLVLGYFFSFILGMIRHNAPVEILLTTMLAYLSFIIAEHYFHVSGVISTVTAGLLLGSFGRTKISLETHEFMENFWETMAFSANSILFICIGLLSLPFLSLSIIADLPQLLIAIVAINVGRAVPIFSLLPLLSSIRFVERISAKFMTVLWWGGGLRGAIAIALALSLIGSRLPESYQKTVMLFTFGTVIFTMLVNALSIRRLISWLGIDRLSRDELYSQKMGMLHCKRIAERVIRLRSERSKHYPDIYNRIINDYREEEEKLHLELAGCSGMTDAEKYNALLRESLLIEKSSYFESFANSELTGVSLRDLQSEVDRELDRLKAGLPLFNEREQFERRSWIDRLIRPFVKFLTWYTTQTLAMRYEKAKATINAVHKITAYLDEKEKEFPELNDICKRLRKDFRSLYSSADEEIADIVLNFPEYVEKVVETVLRTFCLNIEKKHLKHMHKVGQLPDNVYNQLNEKLEEKLSLMKKMPLEKITLDPVSLLKQVSFFSSLDESHLKTLSKHLHTKPFIKGQKLIEEGSPREEMFIITRGVIRVYRGEEDSPEIVATLKSGDILGEMALISKKPRNASAVALSHCSTLVLNKNHFEDFLKENPEVRERIYEVYRERE